METSCCTPIQAPPEDTQSRSNGWRAGVCRSAAQQPTPHQTAAACPTACLAGRAAAVAALRVAVVALLQPLQHACSKENRVPVEEVRLRSQCCAGWESDHSGTPAQLRSPPRPSVAPLPQAASQRTTSQRGVSAACRWCPRPVTSCTVKPSPSSKVLRGGAGGEGRGQGGQAVSIGRGRTRAPEVPGCSSAPASCMRQPAARLCSQPFTAARQPLTHQPLPTSTPRGRDRAGQSPCHCTAPRSCPCSAGELACPPGSAGQCG